MATTSKFQTLVFALTTAIAVGTVTAGAHAESATHVFKPARGISLDVGSKRAAAYFMAGDYACDLTLMFADRPDADGQVSASQTRMNVPVKAGSHTRVYTTDGQALDVSCALSARVMTLRVLEMTAAVTDKAAVTK